MPLVGSAWVSGEACLGSAPLLVLALEVRMKAFRGLLPCLLLSACVGSSPVSGDPLGGGGGGGSGGGGTPAPTTAISVRDNLFNPSLASVPRGDVVVWTWDGESEHNVTWVGVGLVNSPTQSEGSHEARMPLTPV